MVRHRHRQGRGDDEGTGESGGEVPHSLPEDVPLRIDLDVGEELGRPESEEGVEGADHRQGERADEDGPEEPTVREHGRHVPGVRKRPEAQGAGRHLPDGRPEEGAGSDEEGKVEGGRPHHQPEKQVREPGGEPPGEEDSRQERGAEERRGGMRYGARGERSVELTDPEEGGNLVPGDQDGDAGDEPGHHGVRNESDHSGEARQGEEDLPQADGHDTEQESRQGSLRVARTEGDDRREDAGLDDADRRRGEGDDERGLAKNPRDGAARHPVWPQRGKGEDAGAHAEGNRQARRDDPRGDLSRGVSKESALRSGGGDARPAGGAGFPSFGGGLSRRRARHSCGVLYPRGPEMQCPGTRLPPGRASSRIASRRDGADLARDGRTNHPSLQVPRRQATF